MISEQRLCGLNGYHHRSGPWDTNRRTSDASSAVAIGDALTTASGSLDVLVTTEAQTGVGLEAKTAADTATTALLFLKSIGSRTSFTAETKTNSLATTEVGLLLPLSGTTGAMGIDATDGAGDDFYVDQVLSTGTSGLAVVKFASPEYLDVVN